ncbi:hypothetical protein M0802_001567 [Mischocyttarus mexicanus]|nr:hypothetical protein M0802_001567 [Mischocyttarus mexicanus]
MRRYYSANSVALICRASLISGISFVTRLYHKRQRVWLSDTHTVQREAALLLSSACIRELCSQEIRGNSEKTGGKERVDAATTADADAGGATAVPLASIKRRIRISAPRRITLLLMS